VNIKPTLLLAAALFLMSAPEPDSRAVAEMTRNFIVPTDERALQAAELDPQARAAESPSIEQPAREPAPERPEPVAASTLDG